MLGGQHRQLSPSAAAPPGLAASPTRGAGGGCEIVDRPHSASSRRARLAGVTSIARPWFSHLNRDEMSAGLQQLPQMKSVERDGPPEGFIVMQASIFLIS